MRHSIGMRLGLFACLAIGVTAGAQSDRGGNGKDSVVSLLKLDGPQVAAMDRIHREFAEIRRRQETRIADWREELGTAEARTPPDEGRALRLVREIAAAEQQIADAYVRARGAAWRVLSLQQEDELDALRADEIALRRDRYRDLLLLSVEDVWHGPVTDGARRAPADSREAAPGRRYAHDHAESDVVLISLPPTERTARRTAALNSIAYEPGFPRRDFGGPITGLIVDCRGLGVERSMSPKIRLESGSEVWGTVSVNLDWLIEKGIVAYANTLRDAFGIDRAGANPLVISAVGRAGGNFRSDPVVTDDDAERLLRANSRYGFLSQYRVIFIVDPGL